MIQKTFIVVTVAIGCIAIASGYNICKPGESGTFHRDYSSCNGYIGCSNGTGYPGKCTGGYLFNEVRSTCDYPQQVKCSLVCPAAGNTAFRLPNSCSKYISCVGGKASYMECPAGFLFHNKTKNCQTMQVADCPFNNKQCPDPRVSNSFASREKCSAYYKCLNGKPIAMECSNGLHYNAAEQTCDSPSAAKCPIVTNKKEHFNDVEIECPYEGTHFFPHPLNCHLYHICHNGALQKMMCGRGLYYDMVTRRCELAQRARCVVDALKNRAPYSQDKPKETINVAALNIGAPNATTTISPAAKANPMSTQKPTTLDLMSMF